jgi:protein involved in temperature-dependent protein secretion
MTKKIFIPLLACVALFGCNDDKKQEQTLLNDVIKTHDKLMVDDGDIMKSKMQLKMIAKANAAAKDSVAVYTRSLDAADGAMMVWMDKFSPDFTGKTHEQVMTYLNTQKAGIGKIDSEITVTLAKSNNYISKNKMK